MKKYIKRSVVIVSTLLMFLMSVWPVAAVTDFAKGNNRNPVKADNVKLVKKVTVKGTSSKPSKSSGLASTGIVGESISGTRYAILWTYLGLQIFNCPKNIRPICFTVD